MMSSPQKFAESVHCNSAHELLPVGCPGRSPGLPRRLPPPPGQIHLVCSLSAIPHPCAFLVSLHCPSLLLSLSLTLRPPPFRSPGRPSRPACSQHLLTASGRSHFTTFWTPASLLSHCHRLGYFRFLYSFLSVLFPLSSGAVDIFRAEESFSEP